MVRESSGYTAGHQKVMADIFISYLREDIEAAEKLAEALEAHGWSVFWDRRIPAGKRFDDFLDEQLQAAHCIIVLWCLLVWMMSSPRLGSEPSRLPI